MRKEVYILFRKFNTHPPQFSDCMMLCRGVFGDIFKKRFQSSSLLILSTRPLNIVVCISARAVEFTKKVADGKRGAHCSSDKDCVTSHGF